VIDEASDLPMGRGNFWGKVVHCKRDFLP